MIRAISGKLVSVLSNPFMHFGTMLATIFFGLAVIIPTPTFIIVLNGAYIGTMFAITIAYGELMTQSIFGYGDRRKYDDIRQMVIGLFLTWLAYGMSVSSSVYLRAADQSGQALVFTAAGRYVAIIGAIMQITAPNLGEPVFSGRDRKLLWAGVAAGLLLASILIFMQATNALAVGDFLGVPTG